MVQIRSGLLQGEFIMLGRHAQFAGGGVVFEHRVSERMMIPLSRVMDANETGVIAGNSETHCIGTIIGWKSGATASGVPEIAAFPESRRIGGDRLMGPRTADAGMKRSQGITARPRPIAFETGGWIEEGARHRGYSSIEAFDHGS
jgi:hypothetical protein